VEAAVAAAVAAAAAAVAVAAAVELAPDAAATSVARALLSSDRDHETACLSEPLSSIMLDRASEFGCAFFFCCATSKHRC